MGLSGWQYCANINIDNTGNSNALSDYQQKIVLSSSNFDFSKANSDGSDIRFLDSDDSTPLSYWIESWDSSGQTATIWVKVPSIPASSNYTIYMYFGNASATSESNGNNVFDDFDTGDKTSSWTLEGSSGQTTSDGDPQPSYYAVSTSGSYMYRDFGLISNRILTFNVKSDSLGNLFFLTDSSGKGQMYRIDTRGGSNYSGFATTTSWTSWNGPSSGFTATSNTWYKYTIVITSDTSATLYYSQTTDNSPNNFGTELGSFTITNNGSYVGLVGDNSGSSHTTWWDNLIVRKYTSPEPTTTVGTIRTVSNAIFFGCNF